MFGMGMPELLIILLVALMVVGPKKLPDLAKTLGKGLGQFRKATDDLKDSLQENQTYQDLQGIKDNISDTVQSANPKGLLDIDLDAEPKAREAGPAEGPDKADPGAPDPSLNFVPMIDADGNPLDQALGDAQASPDETPAPQKAKTDQSNA